MPISRIGTDGIDQTSSQQIGGISVGRGAGAVSTNTAVGASALVSTSSGFQNTVVGANAAQFQTNNNNTAIGYNSMVGVTGSSSGGSNTAVGSNSLAGLLTGNFNVAVGQQALVSNTTASNNTAVGYQAGYYATGGGNTYIGVNSGANNTNPSSGTNNTTLGYQAGRNISSGSSNVAIGMNTGYSIGTGSNNVYVGVCDVSVQNVTHEIAIATAGPSGKGANTAFISANGGSTYNGANTTTWATTSDRRLKKNIVDNNVGLEKVTAIQVRNFEYRLPREVDPELKPTDAVEKEGVQLGVIAQEIQQILPECVKQESTGVMSVNTDNLIWYLINAVKELKAEIDTLKGQA